VEAPVTQREGTGREEEHGVKLAAVVKPWLISKKSR
jgi:hypothetical protein